MRQEEADCSTLEQLHLIDPSGGPDPVIIAKRCLLGSSALLNVVI